MKPEKGHRTRPALNLAYLGSCGAMVIFASACTSPEHGLCEPKTMEELTQAAKNDDCTRINVHETSAITDLEPLRDAVLSNGDRKDVNVTYAEGITSVSGANNVRRFFLAGPPPELESIEVGAQASIQLGGDTMPPVFVTSTAAPEEQDQALGVIVGGGTGLPDVTLACGAAPTCKIRFSITAEVPPLGQLIALDGVILVHLEIESPQSSWEPLQGLGVPDLIDFNGDQDLNLMQAYRGWLESQGFGGTFRHCTDSSDPETCVTVTP